MIASLTGTVQSALGSSLVIEVAGVGYAVNAAPAFVLGTRVGQTVTVHTDLVVREDSLTLYGFEDPERVSLFRILLGVTGVGPKSALGVLSQLTPAEIAAAVSQDDVRPFTAVSGIGPKTAKLIIVSLTGKLGSFVESSSERTEIVVDDNEIIDALTALGWAEREARPALDSVLQSAQGEQAGADTAALLRLTLVALSSQGRGRRR